jgi:hypothetical protein
MVAIIANTISRKLANKQTNLQLGLDLGLLGKSLLVAIVQVLSERLCRLRALQLESTSSLASLSTIK